MLHVLQVIHIIEVLLYIEALHVKALHFKAEIVWIFLKNKRPFRETMLRTNNLKMNLPKPKTDFLKKFHLSWSSFLEEATL
jgi:hypothetical protein